MCVANEWRESEAGSEVQRLSIILGVAFMSDGRQDQELDSRIGKASAVMRALH